jgi:hypothetical protein
MTKHISVACILVSSAAMAVSLLSPAPATSQQPPAKQKWEYTVSQISDQDAPIQLNKLGESGWELVTFERVNNYARPTFYFKRPK